MTKSANASHCTPSTFALIGFTLISGQGAARGGWGGGGGGNDNEHYS